MTDRDDIEDLEIASEGLSDSLNAATATATIFQQELQKIRDGFAETGREAGQLERVMSVGVRRAFDGLVFGGDKLSDVLEDLTRSVVNTFYKNAITPVTDQVGGVLAGGVSSLVQGMLAFADGAPFSQGRVVPFASGGIVNGPTMFPMRGGLGVMGEAGPEAIMPLARGADGKLGVRGAGGGVTQVVVNVSTPDLQGFQKSQGQIAAQLSRALGRANRNR